MGCLKLMIIIMVRQVHKSHCENGDYNVSTVLYNPIPFLSEYKMIMNGGLSLHLFWVSLHFCNCWVIKPTKQFNCGASSFRVMFTLYHH